MNVSTPGNEETHGGDKSTLRTYDKKVPMLNQKGTVIPHKQLSAWKRHRRRDVDVRGRQLAGLLMSETIAPLAKHRAAAMLKDASAEQLAAIVWPAAEAWFNDKEILALQEVLDRLRAAEREIR
jgi:hypothetical protein